MSTDIFVEVAIKVALCVLCVVFVLFISTILYYLFKYWREDDYYRNCLDAYYRDLGKQAAEPAGPGGGGGEEGAAKAAEPDVDKTAEPDVDKTAGREGEVAPEDRDTTAVTIGLCVERIAGEKEGTAGYAVRIDLGELLQLVRHEFAPRGFGYWDMLPRTMGPVAMVGMVRRIMYEYYKQTADANGADLDGANGTNGTNETDGANEADEADEADGAGGCRAAGELKGIPQRGQ